MGLDDVLRALGDPTRREVVRLLAREGPTTAGELAGRFDLAKSTMSGHFNVLRQAGLVVSERQGQSVVYSASMSVLEEAMAAVLEGFGLGGFGMGRVRGGVARRGRRREDRPEGTAGRESE